MRTGCRGTDIERIDLRVHPLVLELTGKTAPRTGLEGKFSVYHACAAGIVFGRAGEAEFCDEAVGRADLVALRGRVRAVVDATIAEDAADVTITLADGRKLHTFVAHAVGSFERPLDDAALCAQVPRPGRPVLGAERAHACAKPSRLCHARPDLQALFTAARAA